jgi:hypothetical protein
MKKYVGIILILAILLTTTTPVFAIRMIDFIRQRNGVATNVPSTGITPVQPAPDSIPGYDWSTPYYAIVKFKLNGGTLDHIKINSFEASSIDETKFNGWLLTREGATRWYHGAGFYVKGHLTNGDEFFMSIVPLDSTVKAYEFNKDRIYFNAQNVKVFFINYDTGYRFKTNMDTVRFDVRFLDGKVNMAGGNGDEFADDVIRINDMNLDLSYTYDCYFNSWCP